MKLKYETPLSFQTSSMTVYSVNVWTHKSEVGSAEYKGQIIEWMYVYLNDGWMNNFVHEYICEVLL